MAVGGGGVEALFYRGPITPGDIASWDSPGVLKDGGAGGGGATVGTSPPATPTSSGTQGTLELDTTTGDLWACYATNNWAIYYNGIGALLLEGGDGGLLLEDGSGDLILEQGTPLTT